MQYHIMPEQVTPRNTQTFNTANHNTSKRTCSNQPTHAPNEGDEAVGESETARGIFDELDA
jgi:hypothetical protein